MSAPYRIDSMFSRVEFPTRLEEAIYDVVRDAIRSGVSPDMFRRIAVEAWEHEAGELGRDGARVLREPLP